MLICALSIARSFLNSHPHFNYVAIAISSGDYPHISPYCTNFPHASDKCSGSHAPIMGFGSVFQSTEIFPNMMAMPMPTGENLSCFKNFARSGDVCPVLQVGQVFGEKFGLKWEVSHVYRLDCISCSSILFNGMGAYSFLSYLSYSQRSGSHTTSGLAWN